MLKKLFFVAAVLWGSHAMAQNDTTVKSLDEVIVTANRLEQKQNQTGKVVTVIGKETIEKSGGKSLSQLLNEQAGITINGALNNAGTVQTVFMRGAASGRVLVLVDGIPVGDPAFINNEFDLNFLSLNDVERVEIARGAQSTLYGSDAVAGVINIITTRKNINKPLNVNAMLSGGNYATLRGNVQVYGKSGKWSYQAKYARHQTAGFSAAYDSSGNKNFDTDAYKGNSSSALLSYQATQELTLQSFIRYSGYKSEVDASAFTDDRDFTIHNRNIMTGGGFRFKKQSLNITGNYQYTENKRNFLNDSAHVSGFSSFVQDDFFSKSHFAELYATAQIAKGITLLQGVDYRWGSYNNQYLSISSFGPFTTGFRDTSMHQTSAYASLIFNDLKKKWNIELGGRLNRHSRYGNNQTFTFNPSYAVNDALRLFGSIATGFKAPGLYQLYATFGNKNLQPEKSINYEVGVQYQLKKMRNRLVLFYRDINNGIDYDNNNWTYFNFPQQFVRGLEYEWNMSIGKGFNLSGNYTFIIGDEITQSRVTFKDTSYAYLLRRPAHHVNATLQYAKDNKWSASISAKYVSARYDVTGYKRPDAKLNGYFLLNAYAEYLASEKINLFVDAQNLTQTEFFDLHGFNSIPLMLQTGVRLKW
ncbi:MAG: TonB-dependent receptor plug domain-containing protein [Chitinophagaceae bacterium]